ncbi:hypothetical protein CBS101457_006356 [Exobasidium rhododendri]|nr:hypothetical protein CBS101457_006356 [Exobasidium rhododendri]
MTASAIFIRPTEYRISTLLQSLAIIQYFAHKSGDRIINVRQAREPETSRLLNFASITLNDRDAGKTLTSQSHQVPLPRRATFDLPALCEELPFRERRAGLRDVAPLVGIHPATLFLGGSVSEDGDAGNLRVDAMDDGSEECPMHIEVKAERQLKTPKPPRTRTKAAETKAAVQAYNKVGGFSGRSMVLMRKY